MTQKSLTLRLGEAAIEAGSRPQLTWQGTVDLITDADEAGVVRALTVQSGPCSLRASANAWTKIARAILKVLTVPEGEPVSS